MYPIQLPHLKPNPILTHMTNHSQFPDLMMQHKVSNHPPLIHNRGNTTSPVWLRLPIPVFSKTDVMFCWTQTKTNARPKPRRTLENLMGDYWLPVWLRLAIAVFLKTDEMFRWTQTKTTTDVMFCLAFDGRLLVSSLVATTNSHFINDRRNVLLDPNQDKRWRLWWAISTSFQFGSDYQFPFFPLATRFSVTTKCWQSAKKKHTKNGETWNKVGQH